jgi:hypothetical protein
MKPEECEAILVRLDKLERRDRRLQMERLVMLAVIGGLIVTGPVARVFVKAAPPLKAETRSARLLAADGMAQLRALLRVRPVLDPETVIEDQQEAFGEPAPKPAKTVALRAAASVARPGVGHPAPAAGRPKAVGVALASAAVPPGAANAAPARKNACRGVKGQGPLAYRRSSPMRSPALPVSATRAAMAIGRDVEKDLAPLPVEQSFRSLAVADWPAPGRLDPADRTALPGTTASRITILPVPMRPASSSMPALPAAPSVGAAAPVALKALGYAESADGSAQIVLSDGNAVYVVNEGQDFLDRFRVVALRPEGVDVEDRLTNHTFHLNFGP